MALRDQPYLPLYVQDFLTDEKLIECSANSTGVYIRLMCIMHKSEEYGTILLKQKDKQSDDQIKNFALKLVKQMPFSKQIILESLNELLNEKVLIIDGDFLIQKRMVKDNSISLQRALAGKIGGEKTQFAKAKVKAKVKANSENENENVIKDIIKYLNNKTGKKFTVSSKSTVRHITARLSEKYTLDDFKKVIDIKVAKWLNDPKMVDYLRPETLFGNKFEGYLNEKEIPTKKINDYEV